MKKLLALVLALSMATSLVACGKADAPATPDTGKDTPAVAVEDLKEAIAEQPILLTSVGQSADVEMVKTMLTKSELKFSLNNL
ncbi:MAG: DUF6305 family protein, partial [Oscillospiraceae bacterium]